MDTRLIQKRRILVVDDEPITCEAISMLLRFDGHVVVEAHSPREALEAFEPGRFDLVFTDYFMPAMKGDELAIAIKQRAPRQPVVMLTAYPEKFQSERTPLPGVDLYVGKPFELETLRAAVIRYSCVPVRDVGVPVLS